MLNSERGQSSNSVSLHVSDNHHANSCFHKLLQENQLSKHGARRQLVCLYLTSNPSLLHLQITEAVDRMPWPPKKPKKPQAVPPIATELSNLQSARLMRAVTGEERLDLPTLSQLVFRTTFPNTVLRNAAEVALHTVMDEIRNYNQYQLGPSQRVHEQMDDLSQKLHVIRDKHDDDTPEGILRDRYRQIIMAALRLRREILWVETTADS